MPKVFISYSHDSEDHKSWVFELASRLRKMGVDVIFDQFEARLGSDLFLFMEQGLSQSNRVICICSDNYNLKANAGSSGVGYEKRIICPELLHDSSSAWVIPLVRNCTSLGKVPTFLSGLRYISFDDESKYLNNFYELLRDLHNQSSLPPLGKNPFEHNSDIVEKINEIVQIRRSLATSTHTQGKTRFNFISNSGVYIFGIGVYEFKTYWSNCGNNSIYAYSDGVKAIAFADDDVNLNEINLENFDFSSRVRKISRNEHVIWINTNGKIMVTKIIDISIENQQAMWVELEYKIIEVST